MREGIDPVTLALYLSGKFDTHIRIRVENGSGTMIQLSTRSIGGSISFPDPLTPIGSLRLDFLRDLETQGSLAPYVTSSLLNRLDDGVTYSPLLQAGRSVTIEIALTEKLAVRPSDILPLWYEIFRGIITGIDWPRRLTRMATIKCVDIAGRLWKHKSETSFVYAAGTLITTACRQVLNRNGFSNVGLTVLDPSDQVLELAYGPGRQKRVWDQLVDLSKSAAMVILPRYSGLSDLSLVMYTPPRGKNIPEMIIPDLQDWSDLSINDEEIGNVGYLVYTNTNGERREIGPFVNQTSIDKYGGSEKIRRAFWIVLDEKSPARSELAAVNILNAGMADVGDPDLLGTAITPPMPFIECGFDLYQYPADSRFFDSTRNLAPMTSKFDFQVEQEYKSTTSVRGAPSAGNRTWTGGIIPVPSREIVGIRPLSILTSGVWITWQRGSGVKNVLAYEISVEEPFFTDPVPDYSSTSPTLVLGPGQDSYFVAHPPPRWRKFVYLHPIAFDDSEGEVKTFNLGSAPLNPRAVVREVPSETSDLAILTLVSVEGAFFDFIESQVKVGNYEWTEWIEVESPYVITAPMDQQKHGTRISYKVYGDGIVLQENVVSFDVKTEAEIKMLQIADDGGIASIIATHDTDTQPGPGNGRYRIDSGPELSYDIDTSLKGRFDVSRSSVVKTIELSAKGIDEKWGPWFEAKISSYSVIPTPRLLSVNAYRTGIGSCGPPYIPREHTVEVAITDPNTSYTYDVRQSTDDGNNWTTKISNEPSASEFVIIIVNDGLVHNPIAGDVVSYIYEVDLKTGGSVVSTKRAPSTVDDHRELCS